MFCHKCGTQIAEGAAFCHKCGTKVVYVEPAEQPVDTPAPASEPIAASSRTAITSANPAPQAATATIQASAPINVSGNGRNDFKAFVDNHVRETTSFQSAEELLNSKPMNFAWIIFGVLSLLGIALGTVNIGGFVGALEGLFVLGVFFGYAAVFIVSGVIRTRYGMKYSGKLDRIIDLDDFGIFLSTHLKFVSPYFHECGYLTERGGLQAIINNKLDKALQRLTLCCVFGDSEAYMATIAFRPDTATPGSNEMWYTVGATRSGFMIDGRGAGFLAHACLIRTAPIMQAAVLYYINNPGCSAKIIDDTSAAQPADTSAVDGNMDSRSNNATKANCYMPKIKFIGRVLWWGALFLLLPFWNLPVDPAILGTIAAIGLVLISLGPKRPLSDPNIPELVIGMGLLVVAVVYFLSHVGANDKYVQMVKDGTLMAYPQMTVGEAFDNFLEKPKWESGLSDENERFVNVKGGILYYEKEVELLVQFMIVDEEDGTFEYNACEINGVPQINLVYWELLEAIYNGDAPSTESDSRNNSISDIGKTLTYDNIEVTLDYVTFVDEYEGTWGYRCPDKGFTFLLAAITYKNVGTKNCDLPLLWDTLIFDGTYEYNTYDIVGDPLVDIAPLTSPIEGAIIFHVPTEVMESDKSLVLNFGDGFGHAAMSYVLRPDGGSINVSLASTDKLGAGSPTGAREGLCYKGIPVDQLFGKSQADIISIFGEPDSSMFEGSTLVYGDTSMSFEDWSLHEPYLSGIYGGPLEDFTYNGKPFTADGQKIIEIMGREPDYSDVMDQGKAFGTYFITYEWECLGSFARLELSVPADEYSTQTPSIYVYWWNSDAPVDGPGDEYYDDGPYEDYYLPDLPDGFEWVEGPLWDTDSGEIIGVIKNVSGKTKEYVSISFNLYDYNGYRIGSAGDFIFDLRDGNSWKFEANTSKDTAWYEFAELYG